MKRFAFVSALLLAVGAAVVAVPRAQAGNDDVAAIALSSTIPGMGEWYRSGFTGHFPWVECIVGYICPCVRLASVVDAAAGKTDDRMRFAFWSSPS
ncbi:MAG: hypothetical protein JXB39_14015 [Deltaproteobacteria bacterium]|nr:hypothetical protein [Deltaproteobacteria bacterium]